jgi:hypothetical protein
LGYRYAFNVLAGTVAFLVAIATVGGIFVALASYLAATGASAFGNHISHLSIFQSYLNSEIAKRGRVSPASLDSFLWYTLIFPRAGAGNMLVSDLYKDIVAQLRSEIEKSNAQASNARSGSFRYVDHQNRVIEALARFGIKLSRQPRVEFFEIEDEIFSLIRAVNFAFCKNDPGCHVPLRVYF